MSPVIEVPLTPSRQEQALRSIVAALEEAAGSSGPRVHRRRTRPINADDLIGPDGTHRGAVVVYPIQEDGDQVTHGGGREDEVLFALELRAQAGVNAEVTVDELLDRLFVWTLLVIAQDPTFGGQVEDLERGRREWDAIEMDHVFGGMRVQWTGTLFTDSADPREGP